MTTAQIAQIQITVGSERYYQQFLDFCALAGYDVEQLSDDDPAIDELLFAFLVGDD